MKKFTLSHEWISVEEGIGVVGITAHAQQEIGEIVYVELPIVGCQVKSGEEVVVLESTKAAADLYSPVSGEILAVNEALRGDVDLINKSPEEAGWLFKISVTNPLELQGHLEQKEYAILTNSPYAKF